MDNRNAFNYYKLLLELEINHLRAEFPLTNFQKRAIIEIRKYLRGEHGHFAGSTDGNHGHGHGGGRGGRAPVMHKGGGMLNGSAKMSRSERKRVSIAIATNFPNLKPGEKQNFRHGNYKYKFEVIEFGTYQFYEKKELK